MRFMILLKADKNTEAGVLPDEKLLTEMTKDNEALGRLRTIPKGWERSAAGGAVVEAVNAALALPKAEMPLGTSTQPDAWPTSGPGCIVPTGVPVSLL